MNNNLHSDELRSRYNNCTQLISMQGAKSSRWLYVLKYPNKLKIGSTKNPNSRLCTLKGFEERFLFEGTTDWIAELERDALLKFSEYTLLDPTGKYYTEYLDVDIFEDVLVYIQDNLK